MPETKLTLYTHPSKWLNDFFPQTVSYDRVAGISWKGEEYWTDTSQLSSENAYRKTDTEALTLDLPQHITHPIADYFYDFYVNPLRFYRVSDVLSNRNRRSNCHRFGATVLKNCPQEFYEAYGIAAKIAAEGRPYTGGSLQLGNLAVLAVGNNRHELKPNHAIHTMISLGNILPGNYIHTVALGGNLAVSRLEPFQGLNKSNGVSPDVYTHDSPANICPDPSVVDKARRIFGGS